MVLSTYRDTIFCGHRTILHPQNNCMSEFMLRVKRMPRCGKLTLKNIDNHAPKKISQMTISGYKSQVRYCSQHPIFFELYSRSG